MRSRMSPHMDDGAVVGCLFFDVDLFIGFILFFGHSSFPDYLGSARLSPTLFSGLRNSPKFFWRAFAHAVDGEATPRAPRPVNESHMSSTTISRFREVSVPYLRVQTLRTLAKRDDSRLCIQYACCQHLVESTWKGCKMIFEYSQTSDNNNG